VVFRLQLKTGKGDERVCRVYDSPFLASGSCTFTITAGGIADPDEEGKEKQKKKKGDETNS